MTWFKDIQAPIEPPWVNESHYSECENEQHYKCRDCDHIWSRAYINTSRGGVARLPFNRCPLCNTLFNRRYDECVCEIYHSDDY